MYILSGKEENYMTCDDKHKDLILVQDLKESYTINVNFTQPVRSVKVAVIWSID